MTNVTLASARTHDFTIEGLGTFVIRRPTTADKIKIGQRMTMFASGFSLIDATASILVRVKSILDVLADVHPEGYTPQVFDDSFDIDEAVVKFWNEYDDWLATFRNAGTATTSTVTNSSTVE